MKILCFTDSHGYTAPIRRVLAMHPDADAVFFLGDGLSDITDLVNRSGATWFCVRGNCDFTSRIGNLPVNKTEQVTLAGVRFLLTHGDLFGVKYSLQGVMQLADQHSADVVIFGHTHTPCQKFEYISDRGVHFFNPGSICPNDGGSSFGVITVTDKGVLFSHGSIL